MVNVASLVPQPLVFCVLSLTVAKVDSMGLVVRIHLFFMILDKYANLCAEKREA